MFHSFDEAKVWARAMLGIYERANRKSAATADCLDAHRVAGEIR